MASAKRKQPKQVVVGGKRRDWVAPKLPTPRECEKAYEQAVAGLDTLAFAAMHLKFEEMDACQTLARAALGHLRFSKEQPETAKLYGESILFAFRTFMNWKPGNTLPEVTLQSRIIALAGRIGNLLRTTHLKSAEDRAEAILQAAGLSVPLQKQLRGTFSREVARCKGDLFTMRTSFDGLRKSGRPAKTTASTTSIADLIKWIAVREGVCGLPTSTERQANKIVEILSSLKINSPA